MATQSNDLEPTDILCQSRVMEKQPTVGCWKCSSPREAGCQRIREQKACKALIDVEDNYDEGKKVQIHQIYNDFICRC